MIFLFFGTSLALLEAELAPFKDWEEIGNIWDFCLLLFIHQRALSGWGLEFSLRLINLDDDDDDFLFKLPKKLSLVLDVLERFLKKGKSSEFNSRHDGTISGRLTPLQVPQKRKKHRRFIIYWILSKRKANLKFHSVQWSLNSWPFAGVVLVSVPTAEVEPKVY